MLSLRIECIFLIEERLLISAILNLWLILDMNLYTPKHKNIFVTYTQAEKIVKCFGKFSIKAFLW